MTCRSAAWEGGDQLRVKLATVECRSLSCTQPSCSRPSSSSSTTLVTLITLLLGRRDNQIVTRRGRLQRLQQRRWTFVDFPRSLWRPDAVAETHQHHFYETTRGQKERERECEIWQRWRSKAFPLESCDLVCLEGFEHLLNKINKPGRDRKTLIWIQPLNSKSHNETSSSIYINTRWFNFPDIK